MKPEKMDRYGTWSDAITVDLVIKPGFIPRPDPNPNPRFKHLAKSSSESISAIFAEFDDSNPRPKDPNSPEGT